MDRYPFGEGDQWSYQESNEVVSGVRQTRTRPSEQESDAQVLVTPHKMVEAFSVFGVGQDGGNAQTIPQEIAMRDPISESSAPYYTNRSGAIDQNSPWWVWPIGAIPEEITLEGTVEPGDRAKPNDDGKAEQDDAGELLCVSDTVEGRASFVYSPMAGEVFVRAHVTAPDAGIGGGATETCNVISYSDGRDIVSTGPEADRNNTLEVTNWKTELRGETASHQFLVEPWGDGWRIYDEDFTLSLIHI